MAGKKRADAEIKLTPKQKVFVDEYLVDLNATQAAIRAGYSAKNADKIGPELLGKTRVAEAISNAMARREQRTGITQDKVLRELAKIGFANMLDYMSIDAEGNPSLDFSALTREQAAALAEVTVDAIGGMEVAAGEDGEAKFGRVTRVKFKLHDKRATLVDIGRHLGMFPTRLEHTGKGGKPIETVQPRVVIMMPDNGRGDANYNQHSRGSKS